MRRALWLVAVVLLAACGDDDAVVGGTTTTSEATTTSEPATTTTAPTTTTTPACDRIFPGAGNPDQVDATADVDGDGEPDQLHSFGAEEGEPRFTLQVELAAGGGASLGLQGDGVTTVAVLGGADVDGDGGDEIWARVGAGASATIVGLFRFEDCTLAPVTFATGGNAEFPVGGSVGTTSGLECDSLVDPEAHLIVYSASNVAEGEYEVTATKYRLDAGVLTESSSGAEVGSVEDPDFGRIARFHCGELAL